MSLKSQPEFEQETANQTTIKDETMTTTANTHTESAAAGVAATTAIAKAATTGVAVAQKFAVAFADKNNVFDTGTVEGLSLAAPRVKGEQGSLFMGDEDLGGEVHLEMISFNHRWAIGTGEDDKEAKDYFRVSYDKASISGDPTTSVEDYINDLKAQGFEKAKMSPYMDIWGFVTWSEKNGDVEADDRKLVCLQCSQTSLGAFTAFATTRGLLESKGIAKPIEVIGVRAMKRTSGSNKYTNFEFFVPKAK